MSPTATGTVVPMPHMGVSVEEGTVIEWHVAVGDSVEADQLICEIATDKVDTEVLAPVAGVVTAILVQADETVAVGAGLCELDGDGSGASGDVGEVSPDAAPRGDGEAGASTTGSGASGGVSGEPSPTSPPGPGAGSTSAGSGAAGGSGVDPATLAAGAAERAAGGRDEHGAFDPHAAAEAVTSLPADTPLASPLARRIAADRGIELGGVAGTYSRRRRPVPLPPAPPRGVGRRGRAPRPPK